MAVYCSRCGSENPDESKFCYHCGARFAERVIPQQADQSIKDSQQGATDEPPIHELHREPLQGSKGDVTDTPVESKNGKSELPEQPRQESSFEFPAYNAYNMQSRRSPQQALFFEPASFGIRFAAFIIDFVVLSLVSQIAVKIADFDIGAIANDPDSVSRLMDEYLNFIFTGNMGSYLSQYMESFVLVAAFQMILVSTYYLIFHAICGQTPGKFALGIKVTRTDGSPIGFWRSFFRYVVYWLGSRICYIGSFWALFNPYVATWHDLACDTRVYKVSSLEIDEPEQT